MFSPFIQKRATLTEKYFNKGYKYFNAIWSKEPEGVRSEFDGDTLNKKSLIDGLGWYWRRQRQNVDVPLDKDEPAQNIVQLIIG